MIDGSQVAQGAAVALAGAACVLALRYTIAGVRWFVRWVVVQVVEGVDERTNGRIERQLDARLLLHEAKLDAHKAEVLTEVRQARQASRLNSRILARHVRWAAATVNTDGAPPGDDPALDLLDEFLELRLDELPPPEVNP